MKTIFWISVFFILYPYITYPLAMLAIGTLFPKRVKRAPQLPSMTVLIPAYNEVSCIGATIRNKLAQDYPRHKLQIIVVSDGSTDGTDDVVKSFADQGVTLLRREGRQGKAAALNEAVQHARGDIIVFSDANTLFGPAALRHLAENFADPEVGYLTGSMGFTGGGTDLSGAGVSAYMRYENLVRKIETRAGSVIGVNGGVDAIRRELYVDIPQHLITDFILPLSVIAGGHRVIFDPSVTAFEMPNSEIASEFRMRIRVALRALQGLSYMRALLNPLQHPLVCFCIVSHKLVRYLGFLFMALALAGNIALVQDSTLYQLTLALQALAYALALLGLTEKLPSRLKKICLVPSYLVLSNVAFAIASFRFLRGDTMAVWRPRAG
jgi:cellulose synthase/poly-beta-1,6-N-acetylglucosamine synthase-like glycosyltransferase